MEEYPIPASLAALLAVYQQRAEKAKADLDLASNVAINALGIEGRNLVIEILNDPPRFRITRPEGT